MDLDCLITRLQTTCLKTIEDNPSIKHDFIFLFPLQKSSSVLLTDNVLMSPRARYVIVLLLVLYGGIEGFLF